MSLVSSCSRSTVVIIFIMFLSLVVAKKEILQIMNKTISKPRTSRKENGPVVGNALKLFIP